MGSLLLLMAFQNSSRRPGRDRDAFEAIVAALAATAEFAEVALHAPREAPLAAPAHPLAVVAPEEWREALDMSGGSMIRTVSYSLTLSVRDRDARVRFEALDRLSGVAQNALDGLPLGGFCLAGMSRLRQGRYDKSSRHPELRLVLDGEFGYAISKADRRNVAR